MRRFSIIVVIFLSLLVLSNFIANRRHDGWNSTLYAAEEGGEADHLVVIVHGWMMFEGGLVDVRMAATRAFAEQGTTVDVVMFDWDDSFFSNADPSVMAGKLASDLDSLVENRGYERVTLIGHSVGALLIRRAYLYARGVGSDYPNDVIPAMDWSSRVDRLVLLAGMNNGWKRPDNLFTDMALGATGLTGHGKLAFAVERGSPFVGDLRIDWLRDSRAENRLDMAAVIQILGTEEDILKLDDDKDLAVSGENIFLAMPGSDHFTVTDFDPSSKPRGRFLRRFFDNVFRPERWKASEATFVSRNSIFDLALKGSHTQLMAQDDEKRRRVIKPDHTIRRVVFVAHGIRDYGAWTSKYIREVERRDPSLRAVNIAYERFPMVSFMFGNRKKNVRPFVDNYVDAIAAYPNADFSFIGHSNGTYILASALKDYRAAKFDYVYFAGSVVKRNFQWAALQKEGRVKAIRNDTATDDWIVALFPGLIEKFREIKFLEWAGRNSLLGSAGYADFIPAIASGRGYSFKGGHAAALNSATNRVSAVDFALNGHPSSVAFESTRQALAAEDVLAERSPEPLRTLSNFPYVVWLAIGAGLIVLWRLVIIMAPKTTGGRTPLWIHFAFVSGAYILANSF